MHPVCQKIRRALWEAMDTEPIATSLCGCRHMIAAYSGGADSAVLLVLLREYCAHADISLTAVHVHHGIRGAEADRDAAACADFCRERGIDLRTVQVDAPAYAASHGIGWEEAARILRYDALSDVADTLECPLIATAHSADDQLETVLFRLLRGTALDGLCGIPPVRGRIIRPLLSCSAADIRTMCREEGIVYVTDSTNGDTAYTRNYIREEIVPRLTAIHPEPAAAVTRTSALLRADSEYLQMQTESALGDAAAGTSVALDGLAAMPDALLSRTVMTLYENAAHTRRDLSSVHVRDVMRLVRRGGYGRVSMPGDVIASVSAGRLSFTRCADIPPTPPPEFEMPLSAGEHLFFEYGFGLRLETCSEAENADEWTEKQEEYKNIYKLSIRTSIPFATIKGTVHLRFRRAGDTIRSGGMTRRVKTLLNGAKIPPQERGRLPILCDAAGILWIPGFPARDADATLPETGRDGYLSITYFLL